MNPLPKQHEREISSKPTRIDKTALVIAAAFWLLLSIWLLFYYPVREIEQQNLDTVDRFWKWVSVVRADVNTAFSEAILAETWHGDGRHPSFPIILMSFLAGRESATAHANSGTEEHALGGIQRIICMRFVGALFALFALVVLIVWTSKEMGWKEALWAGVFIMTCPHVTTHSVGASVAPAVVAIWVILLWRLYTPTRSSISTLGSAAVWGLGIGTKASISLLPASYEAFRLAERRLCPVEGKRHGKSWLFWMLFFGVGLVVHITIWPWIWRNPAIRIIEHLEINRIQPKAALEFFGKQFNKPPFFYPLWFVMTTTPLPMLFCAIVGIRECFQAAPDELGNLAPKRLSWARLHLWQCVVLLSLFVLPFYSPLNGAEYFLPALFSMAILAAVGLSALPDEVTLPFREKKIPTPALVLVTLVVCLTIGVCLNSDPGRYRNLIGLLLEEPAASAFPR